LKPREVITGGALGEWERMRRLASRYPRRQRRSYLNAASVTACLSTRFSRGSPLRNDPRFRGTLRRGLQEPFDAIGGVRKPDGWACGLKGDAGRQRLHREHVQKPPRADLHRIRSAWNQRGFIHHRPPRPTACVRVHAAVASEDRQAPLHAWTSDLPCPRRGHSPVSACVLSRHSEVISLEWCSGFSRSAGKVHFAANGSAVRS